MTREEILRAKRLSQSVAALGYKPVKKTPQKPKNLDFLNKLTGLNIPKKRVIVQKRPTRTPFEFDYKALTVKDGLPGRDAPMPTTDELLALIEPLVKTYTAEPQEPKITPEIVKEIVQMMHALPENDKLEVSKGIRNSNSFIFGKTKYKIEELMHGAGSGSTTSGKLVTTQYLLTAVQAGSDVTIDISQLVNFATFDSIITLYRNNIPQTEGASYNFTFANPIITVFGADAGEIFNLTYAYTA